MKKIGLINWSKKNRWFKCMLMEVLDQMKDRTLRECQWTWMLTILIVEAQNLREVNKRKLKRSNSRLKLNKWRRGCTWTHRGGSRICWIELSLDKDKKLRNFRKNQTCNQLKFRQSYSKGNKIRRWELLCRIRSQYMKGITKLLELKKRKYKKWRINN